MKLTKMTHFIKTMFISPKFAALYGGMLTITGVSMIKKNDNLDYKKYPFREVKYWYGSCPPYFEYRSKNIKGK